MAKLRRKTRRKEMPVVFVGHSYRKDFPQKRFRQVFDGLPFTVIWGDKVTNDKPRQVLDIMKRRIARADYALFDLTTENPNVALELGMAEGLGARQQDYRVLLNVSNRKKVGELLANIRGLQSIRYRSYGFKRHSLGDKLATDLLSGEYWGRKIWEAIPESDNSQAKRILALRILGHLRRDDQIDTKRVRELANDGGLDKKDRDHVLKILRRRRIIRKTGSKDDSPYRLRAKLYRKIAEAG